MRLSDFESSLNSLLKPHNLYIHRGIKTGAKAIQELYENAISEVNHSRLKSEVKLRLLGKIGSELYTLKRNMYVSQDGFLELKSQLIANGFTVTDSHIIYDHYIPLSFISTDNGRSYTKIKSDKIKQFGWGVSKFSLSLSPYGIKDVFAEGYHPHIHPDNRSWCLSSSLKGEPITLTNCKVIASSMGFLNTCMSYPIDEERRNQLRQVGINV